MHSRVCGIFLVYRLTINFFWQARGCYYSPKQSVDELSFQPRGWVHGWVRAWVRMYVTVFLGNRWTDFPEILHELRNQKKQALHRARFLIKKMLTLVKSQNHYFWPSISWVHLTKWSSVSLMHLIKWSTFKTAAVRGTLSFLRVNDKLVNTKIV